MKALVGAFNQEKALVASRGLLRDYKPSDGPLFEALVSASDLRCAVIYLFIWSDWDQVCCWWALGHGRARVNNISECCNGLWPFRWFMKIIQHFYLLNSHTLNSPNTNPIHIWFRFLLDEEGPRKSLNSSAHKPFFQAARMTLKSAPSLQLAMQ